MQIFMTGATGFIGHGLVRRLAADGHTIRAWVRSPEKARGLLGAGVELIDARDDAALAGAVERADAVVNLAGEPIAGGRWTAERKKVLASSRIDLTARLAAALRSAPERVFVSSSAVGFYGNRGDARVDESSPKGDGFLADLCAAWEGAALAARDVARTVVIRTGVVLGPDGGALSKMLAPFRLGVGGPLGSGKQYLPWIHLADLLEVFASALTDGRYEGIVNGTAPAPVTSRDFARALGHALGRPAILPVPALALRAALGEAAGMLLEGQRVDPRRLTELGFRFAHPEIGEALADVLHAAQVRRAG